MIIGFSTMLITNLITIFTCIDFIKNTVPDMLLVYTRPLWTWFSVGDFVVPLSLTLDGLSLTFLVIIAFLGLLIYFFAASYLTSKKDIYTFYAYSNLLIASMLTVLMHLTDIFLIIGVFLLYQTLGTLNIRDILTQAHDNLAIDSDIIFWITLMLFLVFLLYQTLNTLNIREILTQAHDNLAIDSDIIFWITLMLFLGAISKSARIFTLSNFRYFKYT